MIKSTLTFGVIFMYLAYFASAQEIRVWPNTSVTLESGATLDITAGNLVLKSDASGDASLIDYGNITYSGGGEAKVERYLTEGNWHLISSPVASAQSGQFLGDYLQNHAENSNGWTDVASETYNLDVMKGYALWSVDANPTTEVFSGTTNTGSLNKAFTENGDGWNLMGNPYPSALDWDAVTIPTQLNGAIWLFDPTIGAQGDYLYYINGGGAANTTSQYIPSGQAFFVRATGGSGTLTLDNSDRVHSAQPFYKSADKDLLVLKVSGNNVTTQTAIRFNENATQQADRLFDVYKIISDKPDVPNLFTRIGNETLAINTLPSIEGNEIEKDYPDATIRSKRLFLEDGKLCGEVIIDFENLSQIGLYQYENKGPYMLYVGNFLDSETFMQSNGEFGGEIMPVVFWPKSERTLKLTTHINEPDETTLSLVSEYNNWQ